MSIARLSAALFAPLLLLSGAPKDPPVRVHISDDVFVNGEHARVNVNVAKDGYVVVWRVDAEGRVHVIFPVSPGDSGWMKAGRNDEIRSRGDRDAFTISEKPGTGVVIAARSDAPFNFSQYATGDRWNPDAFVLPKDASDAESAVLALIDKMAAHYDYDAETYHVADGIRRPGHPLVYYDPWYGPYYGPFFGSRFAYFGYGLYPWYYYGPTVGVRVIVPIRPVRPFHGRR